MLPIALFLAGALAVAPAPMFPEAVGLVAGPTVEVSAIIDGDTLVATDGARVRLVGIDAPESPGSLGKAARAALGELAMGRAARLYYGGRRVDRYGRRLAHVRRADGVWLQGAMVSRGLARVRGFADNRALMAPMLALERRARDNRRGLWADPRYAVRDQGRAGDYIGGFELVEGRVYSVHATANWTYLNFAADWHTDFTIAVAAKARALFTSAGLDLTALEGRRVRVRGWIKSFNGPMIEARYPAQIELLSDPPVNTPATPVATANRKDRQ